MQTNGTIVILFWIPFTFLFPNPMDHPEGLVCCKEAGRGSQFFATEVRYDYFFWAHMNKLGGVRYSECGTIWRSKRWYTIDRPKAVVLSMGFFGGCPRGGT